MDNIYNYTANPSLKPSLVKRCSPGNITTTTDITITMDNVIPYAYDGKSKYSFQGICPSENVLLIIAMNNTNIIVDVIEISDSLSFTHRSTQVHNLGVDSQGIRLLRYDNTRVLGIPNRTVSGTSGVLFMLEVSGSGPDITTNIVSTLSVYANEATSLTQMGTINNLLDYFIIFATNSDVYGDIFGLTLVSWNGNSLVKEYETQIDVSTEVQDLRLGKNSGIQAVDDVSAFFYVPRYESNHNGYVGYMIFIDYDTPAFYKSSMKVLLDTGDDNIAGSVAFTSLVTNQISKDRRYTVYYNPGVESPADNKSMFVVGTIPYTRTTYQDSLLFNRLSYIVDTLEYIYIDPFYFSATLNDTDFFCLEAITDKLYVRHIQINLDDIDAENVGTLEGGISDLGHTYIATIDTSFGSISGQAFIVPLNDRYCIIANYDKPNDKIDIYIYG